MARAKTPPVQTMTPEEVYNHYVELAAKLREFAEHLAEFDGQWRLLVRLELALAWFRACGLADSSDKAEPLVKILANLKEIDLTFTQRMTEIEDLISVAKGKVATISQPSSPPTVPGWPDPVHEAVLRMVLRREGIAPADVLLPAPTEMYTGVAGVSRGYTLTVTHNNLTRSVFAKFDEIERAQREWQAIEQLLELPLPPAFILPLPTNQPGDGVIVSEAAATPQAKTCQTLVRYLREQLHVALKNCRDSVERTIAPLREFYSLRVRSDDEKLGRSRQRWKEVYPNLPNQLHAFANAANCPPQQAGEEAARRWSEAAAHFWPGHDWKAERIALGEGEACYNPIIAATKMLGQNVEATFKRSRVHGDLNLTNVLVCSTDDSTPDAIYIIDFANFEEGQLTATDLARLEVALWHEVYFALAKSVEGDLLRSFAQALEVLDGCRTKETARLDMVTERCSDLVLRIRQLAFAILRPDELAKASAYIFQDYFHCLYFGHLYFLGWQSVFQNHEQVHLGLLGAAAALRMIRDRNRFSSGADQPFARPWEQCFAR